MTSKNPSSDPKKESKMDYSKLIYHPFHRFLPPHYMDPEDGIPFSVKWAHRKARHIVSLVHSLQLTEDMLHAKEDWSASSATAAAAAASATFNPEEGIFDDGDDEEEGDNEPNPDVYDGDDDDDDMMDDMDKQWLLHQPPTLASFVKKCHRIYTQLVALQHLKYGGITQMEYCTILLKVIHLLCATVSYDEQYSETKNTLDEVNEEDVGQEHDMKRETHHDDMTNEKDITALNDSTITTTTTTRNAIKATIHWDNVGYIYLSAAAAASPSLATTTTQDYQNNIIHESTFNQPKMGQDFALPTPARDSLFNIALHILDKKSLLRSVSSAAIVVPLLDDIYENEDSTIPMETNDDTLLIIHWKTLYRLLLHTAPYLDEQQHQKTKDYYFSSSTMTMDSSSHTSKIFHSTIHLIRSCRRFFDQGMNVKNNIITDQSSLEIWNMYHTDLFKTYSNNCFKSSILIYLFHPSRCSTRYYKQMVPIWINIWKSIDRTPTFDYIWITMLCRARKYLALSSISSSLVDTDEDVVLDLSFWDTLQTRLLTLLQMWLHIPVGGVLSNDKLFPQSSRPSMRTIPSRLKMFTGIESSEDETATLFRKVSKLLCLCIFIQRRKTNTMKDESGNESRTSRTKKIVDFFGFVSPYFNPSNTGSWSVLLSSFLSCFTYELVVHKGIMASQRALGKRYPNLTAALNSAEPYREALCWSADDMASLVNVLLPICQQAILSKSEYIRTLAMWSLRRLASMDPVTVCPPILDFSIRALDVCSLHNAHQTPVALSAITTLLRPLLRYPSFFLKCLPDILRLSLAGIDSNDKGKTMKTLILYSNVTYWLPIGSFRHENPEEKKMDGLFRFDEGLLPGEVWAMSSEIALQHPEFSSDYQISEQYNDESYATLSEVGIIMSDWVLEFLDRLFSLYRAAGEREKRGNVGHGVASRHSKEDAHRYLAFSKTMKESLHQIFSSADRPVYESILRSLDGFLDETLPYAAKDVSGLCEAVCYVDLDNAQASCSKIGLDFLVKKLGNKLSSNSLKTNTYRVRLLSGCVRYSGRHIVAHMGSISGAILFSLNSPDKHLFKCGCKLLRHTLYSLTAAYPMASNKRPAFSMKPSLRTLDYRWSIPSQQQIAACVELLEVHVYPCFKLKVDESNVDLLRRSLKVIKYAVRGLAILLEDPNKGMTDPTKFDPHEMAVRTLLASCTDNSDGEKLLSLRLRVLSFSSSLLSLISKRSVLFCGDDVTEKLSSIPALSDRKVCKEVLAIGRVLYSHRFRYYDDKTILDMQKDVLNDTSLTYGAIDMKTMLERVTRKKEYVVYNDGECTGKVLSNALLSHRLTQFRNLIESNSSFDQPRRLWQCRKHQSPEDVLPRAPAKNGKEMMLSLCIDDPSLPLEARCLDVHEEIIDHLFSLSCHPNVLVRGTSLNVLNCALSRVGWFMNVIRVSRLHDALSLSDATKEAVYGLPSCVRLCDVFDQQGRRKQLAETIKGVLLILAFNRSMKIMLSTQDNRFKLMKTVCESWRLLYLLPEEDKLKVVAYFNDLFKKFRNRKFKLPRAQKDTFVHESMLQYLIDQISSEVDIRGQQADTGTESIVPWKHKLFFAWYLLSIVEADDVTLKPVLFTQIWDICFVLIYKNMAQPIQKLCLGIIGKLVTIIWTHKKKGLLAVPISLAIVDQLSISEDRCQALCLSLVHNHKDITGGQEQQWSDCVDEMTRDANNNIAPTTLFPYLRACHLSSNYKIHHVQFVYMILHLHRESADYFLSYIKVLITAPPSEDQRNQQITSSELFAAVTRFMLVESDEGLETTLLPFIREIIPKIPLSLIAAYFDALVYAIHDLPYQKYEKLFYMLVQEVEISLAAYDSLIMQPSMIDGFSLQCKWLQLLMSAINDVDSSDVLSSLIEERVLPCLSKALGHPYEVCRGLIAGCLSRICRRSFYVQKDLLATIIDLLRSVTVTQNSGIDLYFYSLLTIRIFLLYCYHREDSRMNYPHLVLPLIPTLFETVHGGENSFQDLTPAQRMIQAEVIKTTKLLISDISTSIVCENDASITSTLEVVEIASRNSVWQVRHAAAHFLLRFQGNHKFVLNGSQQQLTLSITCSLLADDRHEVSAAALAALAGILASSSEAKVSEMVHEKVIIARRFISNRSSRKRGEGLRIENSDQLRSQQQSSVFFLCAAVLSQPYHTPAFVPVALAEISRHSFEGRASPNVRQIVKMVCSEFKRTHMSDNWDAHKKSFSDEQYEALEDVVSAPHYYA